MGTRVSFCGGKAA